jgi:hypothetical protein
LLALALVVALLLALLGLFFWVCPSSGAEFCVK